MPSCVCTEMSESRSPASAAIAALTLPVVAVSAIGPAAGAVVSLVAAAEVPGDAVSPVTGATAVEGPRRAGSELARLVQDAAQHTERKVAMLELDEEDAEGLIDGERP